MTPSGPRHTDLPSVLGPLLLVAEDDALTGVYFPDHRYPPARDRLGPLVARAEDPLLASAGAQLTDYLAGRRRSFELATATAADPWSEQVWSLLRAIPYGATTTYGALAVALGNPALAQRVGQAVGHNPLSIVVPCHRVVGADGSLTGFAGGLERKRMLLELEESDETRAARLF